MNEQKESLLERITKEAKDTSHPSPFSKEMNPFCEGPYFDIGRRAVEILENPDEIKTFMEEYTTHIQETDFIQEREEAEKKAKGIVGYCTGYVDDRKANIWFEALPDITHPITGRKRPFDQEDVDAFFIIATDLDTKVTNYIKESLNDLNPFFNIESVEGTDTKPYITFKLKPLGKGFFGNKANSYLMLRGYIIGLSSRIEDDFGKKYNMGLETFSRDDS